MGSRAAGTARGGGAGSSGWLGQSAAPGGRVRRKKPSSGRSGGCEDTRSCRNWCRNRDETTTRQATASGRHGEGGGGWWVACGLKQGLATLSDGGSVFCTPRSRLTLPLPLEEFKSPKQERPIAARFRRTAGTRRMFTCWSRRHESWQQCTAPCSARVSPWQSRCRTRTSTTASAAGWPAIS